MNKKEFQITIGEMTKSYEKGATYGMIAKEYASDYDYPIIMAMRNGKLVELNKKLSMDCKVKFLTIADPIGNKTYIRGVTMMMLRAIYSELGSEAVDKVKVEYALGAGLYCEILGSANLSQETLDRIEKRMHEMVEEDITFEKYSVNTEDAVKMFESYGMYDKEKLFHYRRSSRVNIYRLGNFEDYFYGSMPPSTGLLTTFALEKYEKGFVLITPKKEMPLELPIYTPSPKLYHTLQESNEWGEQMNIENVGSLNDMVSCGNMQHMILVQEALQEQKIADIAKQIAKRGNVRFVMIAGPSSSGKTTFSHRLSVQLQALGYNPHPIPVDNYFVNRVDTPKDENGNYNYECLEAIDVKQFNEDMTGLLAGKEVELPIYNFITGNREYNGTKKKLGADDILVIEGIHGLNDKLSYSLPKESKFKIYISALTQLNIDEHNRIPTTDGRLIRRMVRDARTRGASAQRTISMWQSVRNGENQYIFPFQEEADAMFNSALIYELSVLKQFAEPLLFSIKNDCEEFLEAKRLLKFLDYFVGVSSEDVPKNSILREFIGNSVFKC